MGLKDTLLSALSQATDSAKGLAGRAADVTMDLAGKAADKAKAGGRIARLTMDIAKEKEEMKKTYLEIGKLYYDTHKDNPDGFFIQLCEEIALAEKSVAAKEAELTELKAGFTTPAEPDVEVEFEEVVGKAEQEAEGSCQCGRQTFRISPIVGRKNHMIKYKGTTLYPPAMIEVLTNANYVENYYITIGTNETTETDDVTITIGLRQEPDFDVIKDLKDRFRAKIRVAPQIVIAPVDDVRKVNFPAMSRKPVTFIDNRKH